MLTEAEKSRFIGAIPTHYVIEDSDGFKHEYDLNTYWSEQDAEYERPHITLEWDVFGDARDSEQPMNSLQETRVEDEDYVEKKVDKSAAELAVVTTAENDTDQWGIQPQIKVTQISRDLWRFFRFQFDQNFEGENGERPILVRIGDAPAQINSEDQDEVVQWQFVAQIRYDETFDERTATVDETSYTVDT